MKFHSGEFKFFEPSYNVDLHTLWFNLFIISLSLYFCCGKETKFVLYFIVVLFYFVIFDNLII